MFAFDCLLYICEPSFCLLARIALLGEFVPKFGYFCFKFGNLFL